MPCPFLWTSMYGIPPYFYPAAQTDQLQWHQKVRVRRILSHGIHTKLGIISWHPHKIGVFLLQSRMLLQARCINEG